MASCKYLPGTCYTCQKCLYCFKPPLRNPCTCPKEKRRTRDKTPQQGQQIYQRVFKPNQPFPKANQFLFNANTEYGYGSNFEESFSYTFCSACNSKNQRLRNKDKKVQVEDDILVISDDSSKELGVNDNSSNHEDNGRNDDENDDENDDRDDDKNNSGNDDVINVNDYDDDDDENDGEEEGDEGEDEDEDEIDEIKVQIIVKSKTNSFPAKTLSIQPANYYNVKEKIHLAVQKILGTKIISKDYTISYKAANSRGPSNMLEDELDFIEFIGEYKKVILSNKKMAIIIIMKDDKTKKKRFSKKVMYFFICK
jgi:hypothetical protein